MKIEKIPEGYLLARKGGNGCELWRKFNGAESMACDAIDELIAERDALRAKIEQMERQEPYSYIYEYANPIDGSPVWRDTPGYWNAQYPRSSKPLYALPGAQNVPSVPDEVMVVLDHLDDYIARIEGDDRGACGLINLVRRYLLDAAEVGGSK